MYRKIYFIGLFFLFATHLIASNTTSDLRKEIDSLLNILPIAEPAEKTAIFIELSNRYVSFSLDSSWEYAIQALNNAKRLKDNNALAEVYKILGNICYYQGRNNDIIIYYDSGLSVYISLGDSAGMAKIWNNLGIAWQKVGDYEKSIEYHLKSLVYKTRISDTIGIMSSNNNIGSLYYDLGEMEKSEEYFLKVLEFSQKINNYKYLPGILNNLGLINQELGRFAASVDFLNKAVTACDENNDLNGKATAYHNLGKSYFMQNDYNAALEFYFKAMTIYKNLGIQNSQTLNNIAQVYIELDYPRQAISYLNQALDVAKTNNQFTQLRDIYNNLSVAYERLGIFDKAYSNYLLFNQIDDSIKNQMYYNRVENIYEKANLESRKKELENINLHTQLMLEKKDSAIRRKNYLIYSFIAGLISIISIALVLLHMFRNKNKANIKLKQQYEEILRSDKIIKKINKALTQNEEMLRSIFDASPSAIVIINNELEILDCNNSCLTMFEAQNKRDILNKKIDHLFVSDHLEKAREFIRKSFENACCERGEFMLGRKDGSSFYAEISGGLIKDTSGMHSAFVMIITDITERLHFIENLKQAKIHAEESDRLKTAFLANMSHEIRTPMNSIIGFSNLLNDPELQQEKREDYLRHILQSSNLLLNLIDDIIDISKIEAGQITINPVICNVNNLLKDIFYNFKETSKNELIEFRLSFPEGSDKYSILTDPLRLRQVLSNLLSNAVKFTEQGYVELGYVIRNKNDRQMLDFYIRDSGIGIPKDKQEIIFERFRQIDDSRTRRFGGTGLGLAISKKLVDLLGGNLRVESDKGQGSTFSFSLPFEAEELVEYIKPEQFDGFKFNWMGKTILIAEDENSNYELIKASISRTKVKIIRVTNGEDAVNHVKNNNRIDLVLMDIRMPKMNGYDATRQIKLIKPDLPVISITAYAMTEDESKSAEAGCDMYISKPIRPSNLLTLLNDFIGAG